MVWGNKGLYKLFARERREGWDTFGNELSNDIQTILK